MRSRFRSTAVRITAGGIATLRKSGLPACSFYPLPAPGPATSHTARVSVDGAACLRRRDRGSSTPACELPAGPEKIAHGLRRPGTALPDLRRRGGPYTAPAATARPTGATLRGDRARTAASSSGLASARRRSISSRTCSTLRPNSSASFRRSRYAREFAALAFGCFARQIRCRSAPVTVTDDSNGLSSSRPAP